MNLFNTRKYKKKNQHFISIGLVLLVSTACYISSNIIGYKIVALILLMTVSVLAMLFDILPVLFAAILSAIIWNFFFIPPIFTFHINDAEDVLMFFLYFIVALVNAVLTFKIRAIENKARDKEEKENSIKLYNTLLNSLSHELRTPIATIIGSIDTLKENSDKLSVSNQHALLNEIDIASIRLNKQVENLLNMSRLETGMLKVNVDWWDMNELVNSTIQKITITTQHTVIFEPNDQLPFFKIDRGLLEQVIYNLIYNAIQYTPQNTIVTITIAHISDNCVITISDNGNGFPENELPFVFNKFYRLSTTKTGGIGLGLSIVKGFVEAHNGKIELANNASGGAHFTIEIPAASSYLNNLKNE